jgi:hypothetical protein
VRFPNGAQCTFGGCAVSFIEQSVFSFTLSYVASNIASLSAIYCIAFNSGFVFDAARPRMTKTTAILTETGRAVMSPSQEHTTSQNSASVARKRSSTCYLALDPEVTSGTGRSLSCLHIFFPLNPVSDVILPCISRPPHNPHPLLNSCAFVLVSCICGSADKRKRVP